MENKFPSFPFVLEQSVIFRNLNLFLNNLFSVWSETEILDSREILRIHETIGLLNLSLSLVASVLINLLMKYGADALLHKIKRHFTLYFKASFYFFLIPFLTKKKVDSCQHQSYELNSHLLMEFKMIHRKFSIKNNWPLLLIELWWVGHLIPVRILPIYY